MPKCKNTKQALTPTGRGRSAVAVTDGISEKDDAVIHYASAGIKGQVFASQYLTSLPDEPALREETQRMRKVMERRSNMAAE